MQIVGHGIDIVETARIARLLDEHGDRFLARCFTPGEQGYASDRRRYIEHLAGRFAAKEAVLKALGTGWAGGILWTEIEVVRQAGGQPAVQLTGRCRQIADQHGVTGWLVSISHIATHATASAISLAGVAKP